MPSAQIQIIRMFGGAPAIPPQAEVGTEDVTAASAGLGSADGPSGSLDVPIPLAGTNLSVVQAFALRVIQLAAPLTTLSNVRFFVTQAGKSALGGAWDNIQILTPDASNVPSTLDAFLEVAGPTQGQAADYVQATNVLGPQGFVGDSMQSLYGIAAQTDILDDANLGAGQIDLTGLGRADSTVATFGNSVNDVSRMLLLQASFAPNVLPGLKPAVQIIVSYDEDE